MRLSSVDVRVRGRRGVDLRRQRLANEPLCRECAKHNIVREATVPDHIIPLAFGGTDTDDNVQCLCEACHRIKSTIEGTAHGGAANHPDWLEKSAAPLTIVCGPPCAGKTTHVHTNARAADTIIDIDVIAARINPAYRSWTGMLKGNTLNAAIRVRNALLGSLASQRNGAAWFIVSAPAEAERTWWAKRLGGEVLLLDPGLAECKARAVKRGTPGALAGIDDWYRRAVQPWRPAIKRQAIGLDGWPVES